MQNGEETLTYEQVKAYYGPANFTTYTLVSQMVATGEFGQAYGSDGSVLSNLAVYEQQWRLNSVAQTKGNGPGLNAEAFINDLLLMKVGDKITGDQLDEVFKSNSIETPISISKVTKNLTRVDVGFQINLTLLARGALALIPKSPEVKNGAIISITQEAWPDGKNTVLYFTSPDVKIYYNNKLVPLTFT